MIFWILTLVPPPPPLRTWVPLFWGGVKTSLRVVAAVCVFEPGAEELFFLYTDPLTRGGGPGSQLKLPPPIWPFAREASETVFTLDRPFS